MSNFGDLVKRLRKERAMTLDQVARKIGSHKGYVSGIENGKVNPPSVKFIRKFARLFSHDEKEMVRIAWLDKAPKLIKDEISVGVPGGASPAPSGDAVSVPLLNSVSTGYPVEVAEGRPRPLTPSVLTLPKGRVTPDFAATICDNSMEQPEGFSLSKGDIVFLAPVTKIKNGSVVFVVFSAKGRRSALVRQVMLEQNEHVVLQPINKDYPLEFLTHDDIDVMFRVVGRLEMFAESTVDSTV
jgi:transcriptional regulator with XRE-family HTH domain